MSIVNTNLDLSHPIYFQRPTKCDNFFLSRVRIEVAFPVISIVKLMMMKWEGQPFPNVNIYLYKIVFALNYLDILLVILQVLVRTLRHEAASPRSFVSNVL